MSLGVGSASERARLTAAIAPRAAATASPPVGLITQPCVKRVVLSSPFRFPFTCSIVADAAFLIIRLSAKGTPKAKRAEDPAAISPQRESGLGMSSQFFGACAQDARRRIGSMSRTFRSRRTDR